MTRVRTIWIAVSLMAAGATLLPAAQAADPVRGKALYFNTNGAVQSCGSAGCHNGFPAVRLNKINAGTNPAVILSAIAGNKGKMGFLSAFVNATDAADIAAYIANPAAGDGAASIALSSTSLTFVAQTVGTSSTAQTVTVSNPGTSPLTISSLTFSGTASADFARAGTCMPGGAVAAGASCLLSITFTPAAAGTRSAALTIGHNATGGSSTVTLSGTGNPASAVAGVSPSALTFSQTINTTSTAQTVTLANTGGSPLTINSVTLGGASAAEYALAAGTTCTAGATVNGGANCVVRLTFTPAAVGARPAGVSIAHSASGTAATVALNGSGSTAPQPAISLSAASLTFDAQSVGSTSAAQSVTLTNTGQAALSLTSLTVGGAAMSDFTRSGTCAAGGSIAAGATCTIQVAFAPTAVGARNATLTIASNAANGNATLALGGTGMQVAISITPMSATLQAPVGAMSDPVRADVSNTGQSPLTISSIAATGPFMLHTGTNACGEPPITLTSGQSCTVFVAFHPPSTGMFAGEVVIASNASAVPARVALSAEGVPSGAEAANVGFGGCSVGRSDQLVDPMLAVMLAIAVFVVLRRRAQ